MRPARAQAAAALDGAYYALLEHALSPTLAPSPAACLPAASATRARRWRRRWTARKTTLVCCFRRLAPTGWMGGAPSCKRHARAQVAAALDGAYYALLEHALCCGWAAPAVPPPHAWFPAFAAAHPGAPARAPPRAALPPKTAA